MFSYLHMRREKIGDSIGRGTRYTVSGLCEPLQKMIEVVFYDDFPSMAVMQVTYINVGNVNMMVDKWTNHHYNFKGTLCTADEPVFWSYQSGSYADRYSGSIVWCE